MSVSIVHPAALLLLALLRFLTRFRLRRRTSVDSQVFTDLCSKVFPEPYVGPMIMCPPTPRAEIETKNCIASVPLSFCLPDYQSGAPTSLHISCDLNKAK